jgi:hypothetical protein
MGPTVIHVAAVAEKALRPCHASQVAAKKNKEVNGALDFMVVRLFFSLNKGRSLTGRFYSARKRCAIQPTKMEDVMARRRSFASCIDAPRLGLSMPWLTGALCSIAGSI